MLPLLQEAEAQLAALPAAGMPRAMGAALGGGFRDAIKSKLRGGAIWVKNGTGAGVTVMVERRLPDAQLLHAAFKAAFGSQSVSLEAALDWAYKRSYLSKEPIAGERTERVMITLGEGSGGAYLTAYLTGRPEALLCERKHVPPGCVLTLLPGTDAPLLQPDFWRNYFDSAALGAAATGTPTADGGSGSLPVHSAQCTA